MSSTHKALHLDSKFGNFVIGTQVTPSPGEGEILIKIESAGLNPVDWKIRKYGFLAESFPAILGSDTAGVVEAVGNGVEGLSKGDRVLYQNIYSNDFAGFQQYSLAKAENVAKIPDNVTNDQAASISVGLATAFIGLYAPKPKGAGYLHPLDSSGRNKYVGEPLVVLGGATSVGQYTLQLARLSGFSPIITTASLKHSSLLKDFGATHVIDRHQPLNQLSAEVAKITDKQILLVYDSVSTADTTQAGYDLLANGGQIITIVPSNVKTVPGKDVLSVFGSFRFPETQALGKLYYAGLHQLLADGDVKPNIVEVIPGGLGGIAEGLKRLEDNLVSGYKLVVHPQESD